VLLQLADVAREAGGAARAAGGALLLEDVAAMAAAAFGRLGQVCVYTALRRRVCLPAGPAGVFTGEGVCAW
jgi:hypothetical protein